MTTQICDNLTVIEIGTGPACALAGMILADNGARVLKVEPPGGDPLRRMMRPAFHVWNRGKESIELDIRSTSGQRSLDDLVACADVCIDALSSQASSRAHFSYERFSRNNPGLIYCIIRSFGGDGPLSAIKGYEGLVTAKAGGFSLREDADTGTLAPRFTVVPRASIGAAHSALHGILAGLISRSDGNLGQRVETSLYQGLTIYDYASLPLFQIYQRDPQKYSFARQRLWPLCSKDNQWLSFSIRLPMELEGLVRALELDEIWEDPRFRLVHRPGGRPTTADPGALMELWDRLATRFRERTRAEWDPRILAEPDLGAEWAVSCEQSLAHPQMQFNGHVVEVSDSLLGTVKEVGPIARFAGTPSSIGRGAPRIGEHGASWEAGRRSIVPDGGSEAGHHRYTRRPPLEGMTVLEIGHHYAMPFALALVAELGARVIKIEHPDGDHQRDLLMPMPEVGAIKTLSGKESVVVDAHTTAGQEVIYRLAASADAFTIGLRQPAIERMNLRYEDISRLNSNIVYLCANGYGDSGPYVTRAMHAGTASAASGVIGRESSRWLTSARAEGKNLQELRSLASRFDNGSYGDATAAANAATALLLALFAKKRLGRGQYVSTTMLVSNAYSVADDFCDYADKPEDSVLIGDGLGLEPFYRMYRCAEGWVFLAAPTTRDRSRLMSVPEFSALADAAWSGRSDDSGPLMDALAGIFAKESSRYWETYLGAHEVGCVDVFVPHLTHPSVPFYEAALAECAVTNAELRTSDLVIEVDEPVAGRMFRYGPHVRLSESPPVIGTGSWSGEHTLSVLTELGYSPAEIDRLSRQGVIASRRTSEVV